jgi:FKBP-type peptidyl-prolyl cis-trans isomerase
MGGDLSDTERTFNMKTIILIVSFSLTMTAPLLGYNTNVLSNDKLRFSYAMGMLIGSHWRQQNLDLNDKMVFRAVKEAQAGTNTLMTAPEMNETLRLLQQQVAAKEEEHQKALAEKNKKVGDAFLAKNKQKNGVMTFPNGLQYKILAEGDGLSPSTNDLVTVNYEGTFIDGAKLESADKKQLPVGSVIPGWTEALIHMKVGSKWQLFIPPDLAYGQYGRPPRVGPNSVLIFTIELVSIEHPQPITSDIIKVPSAEEMKNGAKVEIIKPEDLQKAQQSSQPAK